MRIGYRIDGPGAAPVLVLSSSLGTTAALWDGQATVLERRFRVLRYDHPGHGRSPAPDGPLTVEALADGATALLDSLEIDRVSFCGLSLGGMVGMALALQAPARVDRLVLCCTSACLGPPEGWLERARLVRESGTEAIADAVLERWFTEELRREQPATVARFRRMLVASTREGYAACCEAISRWDARERIRAISAPTLVIAGADDPATPPAHAELLTSRISRSELVVLPRAAHLANVEQAAAFNRAVLQHLPGTSTSEEAA